MELTTLLLYTLIGLTSLALYLIRKRYSFWQDRGIICPEPSLIYGNFQGVMKTRTFAQITEEAYMKYKGTGPFVGFYFFHRPAALVLATSLVKNVLIKDFNNFADRGLYSNPKDDPLTGHLFLLDSDKWRTLRNKLSPTFTSGKMKYMFPTVVKVGEEFAQVFDDMLDKHNGVVEIKELLARFSTDVIGTCAFGINCNSLKDPKAEFRIMGARVFTDPRHGGFVQGLMESFPNMARKLRAKIFSDEVHDFFMRIVRETLEYREANQIQRNDFMDLLIKLRNENDELKSLTVEEVAAQAFVFYLAGFETSSSTLGFTLYELAQQLDIQERVRQELADVLSKHNQKFTYECMQELHYMDQVISETLRKYPIVPHLNRQALHDYVVPGQPKYVIPKGTMVLISVIGIQRDPDIYPHPEVFDPERFSSENIKLRDPETWLPFGDGPRNCIGMRFGQMQMRVALTFLLRHFKFSTCAQTEIPLEMNTKTLVMNSKNGIFLKVERI